MEQVQCKSVFETENKRIISNSIIIDLDKIQDEKYRENCINSVCEDLKIHLLHISSMKGYKNEKSI